MPEGKTPYLRDARLYYRVAARTEIFCNVRRVKKHKQAND
jgi:hypothetical protein